MSRSQPIITRVLESADELSKETNFNETIEEVAVKLREIVDSFPLPDNYVFAYVQEKIERKAWHFMGVPKTDSRIVKIQDMILRLHHVEAMTFPKKGHVDIYFYEQI